MARIVIFANGIITDPEITRARLRPTDRIFCADGGALHVLALDLTPEVIIGDLDSLPAELVVGLETQGVIIHRYPVRKDQTDLELAFQLAAAENPEEILLLAALGGRLDQMLANVLLLTRPEYAPIRLSVADGPQVATLVRSGESLTVAGQPGDTISLIPLSAEVREVSASGVEWPLNRASLVLGSTWGISNVLVAAEATVQIGAGTLLVVLLEAKYEEVLE